jgi:hypothetical protein
MTLFCKNKGDTVYFMVWKSCQQVMLHMLKGGFSRSIPSCMIVDNVKYLIHAIDRNEEALLGGMWQKI